MKGERGKKCGGEGTFRTSSFKMCPIIPVIFNVKLCSSHTVVRHHEIRTEKTLITFQDATRQTATD